MNALEEILGVFQAILRWGEVGDDVGFCGVVEAVVQVERINMRCMYGSTVHCHFHVVQDIETVSTFKAALLRTVFIVWLVLSARPLA